MNPSSTMLWCQFLAVTTEIWLWKPIIVYHIPIGSTTLYCPSLQKWWWTINVCKKDLQNWQSEYRLILESSFQINFHESNNQEQGLTFSRWEQRASTAVEDHELPIEFDTKSMEALLGNKLKSATLELRAAQRIGDLNMK